MLPISLDCPFLIAPSVFSNIYLSIYDIHTCHSHDAISINNRSRTCALDAPSPRMTFRYLRHVLFGFSLTTNPNIVEMFLKWRKHPKPNEHVYHAPNLINENKQKCLSTICISTFKHEHKLNMSTFKHERKLNMVTN